MCVYYTIKKNIDINIIFDLLFIPFYANAHLKCPKARLRLAWRDEALRPLGRHL